jgi:hypothetical protein
MEEIEAAYDQNPEALDEAFFDNISKGIKNFMGRFKKSEPVPAADAEKAPIERLQPEDERKINVNDEERRRVERKQKDLKAYRNKLIKMRDLLRSMGSRADDANFNNDLFDVVNVLKKSLLAFDQLPELTPKFRPGANIDRSIENWKTILLSRKRKSKEAIEDEEDVWRRELGMFADEYAQYAPKLESDITTLKGMVDTLTAKKIADMKPEDKAGLPQKIANMLNEIVRGIGKVHGSMLVKTYLVGEAKKTTPTKMNQSSVNLLRRLVRESARRYK